MDIVSTVWVKNVDIVSTVWVKNVDIVDIVSTVWVKNVDIVSTVVWCTRVVHGYLVGHSLRPIVERSS